MIALALIALGSNLFSKNKNDLLVCLRLLSGNDRVIDVCWDITLTILHYTTLYYTILHYTLQLLTYRPYPVYDLAGTHLFSLLICSSVGVLIFGFLCCSPGVNCNTEDISRQCIREISCIPSEMYPNTLY